MDYSIVYLDESGDLGWRFDKPYQFGGSSRYLTVGGFYCDERGAIVIKRFMRRLYKKAKWNPKKEKKWSDVPLFWRRYFTLKVSELVQQHPNICLIVGVANKRKVNVYHRGRGNLFYNFLVGRVLGSKLDDRLQITFRHDSRSAALRSIGSLHDYLQTLYWFHRKSNAILDTRALSSERDLLLQFSDMVAGAVQTKYEWNQSEPLQPLASHITLFEWD